ncbi:ferric reductase [Plectosphaerella plurivora]|uniref:ferric-chelate reductase (NADPH) n=1 Tax=Plectosphaerella plurivora TaxID=936078 RepID=A0A9P8VE36_9PEZI|nr:ferric reductase [Plectosphaerella plurivora]
MESPLRTLSRAVAEQSSRLDKRIFIPIEPDSPPGLVEAHTADPWEKSGKYALGMTFFALALMSTVLFVRIWHFWQDKIRQAIYKGEVERHYEDLYNVDPDRVTALRTGRTTHGFQPEADGFGEKEFRPKSHMSSVTWFNDILALFRWIFYRPIPDIRWRSHVISFSSIAVLFTVFITLLFVVLYCFLLQPLFWQSIRFGSPPVAIRSGMIALALTPWIIATSMKANIISVVIGIGPERLNVFHRWAGYICLFLSLVHTVPFYVQPVWDDGGMAVFEALFEGGSGVIYGTGIACLVPLLWLCVASLPFIRRLAYEAFVLLHIPVAMAYVAMLWWHSKNYLNSWDYIWTTVAIWIFCNIMRVFKLNWLKPWRMAFLVGDEAAITLLSENAIKVTIPTQMRWKPGQFVYLRMPGISLFENHPFTISSLCSEDFPSEYGEQYRDCVVVFKPYGGFTRRVLETAIEKGPFHTYRAFLDGPYGGMRRDLAAFDTCILIAGGTGITALMSQLLNLIKRMREGKAITKKVVVIWSIKRLEALDWFREELRICRESAPPESVTCKFFVTSAVRNRPQAAIGGGVDRGARALSHQFHDKLDGFVAGIASKRNSALIQSEAQGDLGREMELRNEDEDRITALPQQKYLQPHPPPSMNPANRYSVQEDSLRKLEGRDDSLDMQHDVKSRDFHFNPINTSQPPHFNYAPPQASPRSANFHPEDTQDIKHSDYDTYENPDMYHHERDGGADLPVRAPELAHLRRQPNPENRKSRPTSTFGPPSGFDFGFPQTPTDFQKNLMRFAFPVPHQIDGGWSVEYGRPDLGFMLKEWATGGGDGRGILGRRTAVFVCGPATMREGVASTVAKLQAEIWGDPELEEIYLHTENYAL